MNARARKTHPLRLFTRGREKKMHMHTHKGSTAAAKVNSFLTFMKIFTEHFSAICLNFAVWSKHLSQRRLYVLGAVLHQGLGVAPGSKTHTTSPSTCDSLTLRHRLTICHHIVPDFWSLWTDFASTHSHRIPHPLQPYATTARALCQTETQQQCQTVTALACPWSEGADSFPHL